MARLLGSRRDWPELPPLDVDGIGADYLELAQLKAERNPYGEDDDED